MVAFTKLRLTPTVATALAASLALSGCNKASDEMARSETAAPALPDLPATLPLANGAATPVAYAPGPSELPDTRAIPAVRTVAPADAYAYADQAYGFMDALGDAPPDYGFDYDGVDPWAWQGYDDSVSFAEPIDGGYRYYYYRPGAETPYFIRDPRYGYGYDDGQLAVVYAADGAVVPYESYGPQIGYASRYWVRGRDLWRASRANPRRGVIAANWVRQRPEIIQSRERWQQDRPRQAGWVAYHQTIAPRQERHWEPEQVRREADSRRYADWQRQDFRTPPPPRAIPVRWQQASWAKDPSRFAPARAAVARYAGTRLQAAPDREADRGFLDRLRGNDPKRAETEARPPIGGTPDIGRREAVQRQIAENQARRRETMQVVNEPQRAAQAPARGASRPQETAARTKREQGPARQVAQGGRARLDRSRQADERRQVRQQGIPRKAAGAEQQAQGAARAQRDDARAGREQARAAQAQARAAEAGQQQAREQARAAQQARQGEARQAQQVGRAQAQAERAQARQARAGQAAPQRTQSPAQRASQPAAPRQQGGGNPGGGDRGHDRGGPPHR